MEYKRLSSKGGLNVPVKLRRFMGIEPKDPMELEVNEKNELVVRPYQVRCIFCGEQDVVIKKNGKGVCQNCAEQMIEAYGNVQRKGME